MKKYIHKKAIILAIAIIGVAGCTKFIDEINDFKIGITNAIFEQTAVLELKDALGNYQGIIDTDFTVTFSGADADKLVSEAGEFNITETDGFIQLGINPNKSTGVKELNFDVTISGGSYRTETFPVTLKDTVSKINLTLFDEIKIYKGQNEASTTASLTGNTTTTATTVKTTTNGSANTSAVTIKTGTQFKDVAGNLLSGGDVKIAVTNTDALSDVLPSTSAFTFKDNNGTAITDKEASFLSGNTQIKMEVNGTAVKKFNNAIDVAIEIPSDATNPTTGNPLQLGDTFPVYTNEDDSTDWTYHGLGTITAGATAATFNISFETTHLSNYAIFKFVDVGCWKIGHNITVNDLPTNFNGAFEVKLRHKRSGYFGKDHTLNIFEIQIQNGKVVSVNTPIYPFGYSARTSYLEYNGEIKDLLASGNDKITTNSGGWMPIIDEYQLSLTSKGVTYLTNLSNFAAFASCVLSINLSKAGIDYLKIDTLKNINIDVSASCSGNTIVLDGFPLYVERDNGVFSYEGTIKKGKMTLTGFELGKEYNFKTVYKGNAYYHKWTFTGETFKVTDFEIPANLCSEIGF